MNDFFSGVAALGTQALGIYEASQTSEFNREMARQNATNQTAIQVAQANSKKYIYVGVMLIAGVVLLKITKVI